jgi:hypothetical protein
MSRGRPPGVCQSLTWKQIGVPDYFIFSHERMVYIVGHEDKVKIGRSAGVYYRLLQLQCQSPVRLQALSLLRGEGKTERNLHARFIDQHCYGEWFTMNAELSAFIKKHPAPQWMQDALDAATETNPPAIRKIKNARQQLGYNGAPKTKQV